MIAVTRLNGEKIYLNAELIETVETRPDTLITLINGNKIMVKENVSDIIKKIRGYHREVNLITKDDIRKIIAEESY